MLLSLYQLQIYSVVLWPRAMAGVVNLTQMFQIYKTDVEGYSRVYDPQITVVGSIVCVMTTHSPGV